MSDEKKSLKQIMAFRKEKLSKIKDKPYLIKAWLFLSFHNIQIITPVRIRVTINKIVFPPGNERPKAIPSFVTYVKFRNPLIMGSE